MRWLVEVSTIGGSTEPQTLCVEAAQWQPALQAARKLLGAEGAITGFSIELLSDGYRAVDEAAKRRYVVRRAAGEVPLSTAADLAAPASQPAPTLPSGGAPDSGPTAAERDPAPAPGEPEPTPVPLRHPKTPVPAAAPIDPDVIFRREEAPSEQLPLSYREVVWWVTPGTAEAALEQLLRDRFEAIRAELASASPGKMVNLALYDERFEGRPRQRPLVTLHWKDWKGSEPEVRFPRKAAAEAAEAVPAAVAAEAVDVKIDVAPEVVEPKAAEVPAVEAPKVEAEPEVVESKVEAEPKGAAERTAEAPVAAAPAASVRKSPASVRPSGDDLIGDLFEAMHDLHFLADAIEGAQFALRLALEKIPCDAGIAHLFDINKREFVVVHVAGGAERAVLMTRTSDRDLLVAESMRRRRALTILEADERTKAERWQRAGVPVRTLLVAPVELAGRFLGLLELANPSDGDPFTEAEAHALTYIGEQLGEFVATRGVLLDAERVTGEPPPVAPKKAAVPRPSVAPKGGKRKGR